jgi:ferredoxin
MSDNIIEENVRIKARMLLEDGKIKYFIGYERCSDSFYVSPCFVKNPKEVKKLIWDPLCVNNLVVYLIEDKKKVLKEGEKRDNRPIGILLKGCDSRSLVQLISEHKVSRDEIIMFGVPCRGVLDPRKLERWAKEKNIPAEAFRDMRIHDKDGEYMGEYKGKRYDFPRSEFIMGKCKDCMYPNPVIFDEFLDKEVKKRISEKNYVDVGEIETLPLEKRWKFWSEQFSRCIRCSACKNVCPLCYCKECAVDPANLVITPKTTYTEKADKMIWLEKTVDLAENIFFHLTRMMHMAGRCVNCGECERVCPMSIPLGLLTRKLEKDVKEMFDYEAGVNMEAKPLLAIFEEDDPTDFIK